MEEITTMAVQVTNNQFDHALLPTQRLPVDPIDRIEQVDEFISR